ncbi:unnamed protein product [Diamesa serratosioi]
MVSRHFVKGWDEFEKLVVSLEPLKQPINVFFSGDKDELTGVSWCPYCVKADPVIEKALESASPDSQFIHVEIPRPFWKDLQNPFRKDPRCNLVFLPTILRWKGAQRLDGERASSADLVEMLFEDED